MAASSPTGNRRGAAGRRREPWPVALALALLAMIGVCVAFFAVAVTHPDTPLDLGRVGLRPTDGYVAPDARAEARR